MARVLSLTDARTEVDDAVDFFAANEREYGRHGGASTVEASWEQLQQRERELLALLERVRPYCPVRVQDEITDAVTAK